MKTVPNWIFYLQEFSRSFPHFQSIFLTWKMVFLDYFEAGNLLPPGIHLSASRPLHGWPTCQQFLPHGAHAAPVARRTAERHHLICPKPALHLATYPSPSESSSPPFFASLTLSHTCSALEARAAGLRYGCKHPAPPGVTAATPVRPLPSFPSPTGAPSYTLNSLSYSQPWRSPTASTTQ
jgi:hypothetical protein